MLMSLKPGLSIRNAPEIAIKMARIRRKAKDSPKNIAAPRVTSMGDI